MNGCHSVASARTCRIRFRNIVISHPLACQGISYTLNPFKRISFCMLFMNKKCWNACHPRAIAKTHFIIANKALRLSYKTGTFVSPICNTVLYKYILKLQIPFISGSNLKILYQFKLQSSLLKHLQ